MKIDMQLETKHVRQLEEKLKMVYEFERLKTFKKWPFKDTDSCSATKMAEAGWVYIGNKEEPDSAECFVCFKQLHGFESTDDPMEEHKNHTVNCPFVKLGKIEKEMTVLELGSLKSSILKNVLSDACDAASGKMSKAIKSLEKELLQHVVKSEE